MIIRFILLIILIHVSNASEISISTGYAVAKAVPVKEGHLTLEVPVLGEVYPADTIELQSPAEGEVLLLNKEGTFVSKDDPIVEIDTGRLENILEQELSSLEALIAEKTEFQSQLERREELVKKRVVTKEEYDSINTSLKTSLAKIKAKQSYIDNIKLDIANSVIYAPYSGFIQKRYITNRSYVSKNQKLLLFSASDVVEIRVHIPIEFYNNLTVGDRLQGMVNGNLIDLTMLKKAPINQQTNQSFYATLTSDSLSDDYIIGSRLVIRLQIQEPKLRYMIPKAAFHVGFDGAYTFILDENSTARKVQLDDIRHSEGYVSVSNRELDGKKVLLSGQTIINGQSIQLE